MAAMLQNSIAIVAVVRTRPQAIPLAMITMRKSIHGFPLVSYIGMGLRLAGRRSSAMNERSNYLYRACFVAAFVSF